MFAWLARTCKTGREVANVSLGVVGAEAGRDPSTIYRFEERLTYPRDTEALVRAYAKCIGVPPQLIWADALHHWGKEHGNGDGDLRGLRDRALGLPSEEERVEALLDGERFDRRMDMIDRRMDMIDQRMDRLEEAMRLVIEQIGALTRHLGLRTQ